MRGVDHPSVVKLISFTESDEHYFLILERMSHIFLLTCHLTHFTVMEGGELFHQM